MNLRLPPPEHGQLMRPPLTLVVCQLRFETIPTASDGKAALQFLQQLGDHSGDYGRPEKADVQSVAVELDGQSGAVRTVPSGRMLNGWRFKDREEPWLVSLMPDFVSLETTGAYSSWRGFRNRLTQLLDATQHVLHPDTELRLGMRYVDQITEPEVTDATGWTEHIQPSLLGMVMHPHLGPAVRSAQQQFELRPSSEFSCVVRVGFFPDDSRLGQQTLVLDTDVFREGVRLFDSDEILLAADSFHEFALQVFQESITEKLLAVLREDNASGS